MRRDRNRRGSAKAPRDNATQPRSRAAARAPQSPESAVINVLRKAARPLRLDEVAAEFGPAGAVQAEQDLAQLVKRGEVMLNRRGQYCLREQIAGLVVGTVQGARNGDGQLLPDDGSAAIYLPAVQMREVMHGDRLAVRIEATRYRGKAQGTIVEVLERRTKEVVGRLHTESGVAYLTPDNPRIPHRVLVPSQQLGAAVDGQIVMVELTHQPSRTSGPVGRVARILGDHGAPGMETEIAIHSHSLPCEFPATVVAEAEAFGTRIPQDAIAGREDLRDMELVTIDGEDARDFDDAVWCERKSGGWRVIVAIADVAHYVRPGSPLDVEARERGTSVYFPNRVLPMLPEALSNGLCSLKPDEDRLCLCCELRVGEDGRITRSRFFEGVMRSVARLTYRDVGEFLEKPVREARAETRAPARTAAGIARRVQVVHPRAVGAWCARTRHAGTQAQVRRAGQGRGAGRIPAQRRAPPDRGMHDRGERRGRAVPRSLQGADALSRARLAGDSTGWKPCARSCASSGSGCRPPTRSRRTTCATCCRRSATGPTPDSSRPR